MKRIMLTSTGHTDINADQQIWFCRHGRCQLCGQVKLSTRYDLAFTRLFGRKIPELLMVPLRQSILSGSTGALCTDSEAGSRSIVFGLDKWQPLAVLALTLGIPLKWVLLGFSSCCGYAVH